MKAAKCAFPVWKKPNSIKYDCPILLTVQKNTVVQSFLMIESYNK